MTRAQRTRKLRTAERETIILSIMSMIGLRKPKPSRIDWMQRRRKMELIEKLQRLAGNNPSHHEAQAATRRAAELAVKYGLPS